MERIGNVKLNIRVFKISWAQMIKVANMREKVNSMNFITRERFADLFKQAPSSIQFEQALEGQ